MVRLSLVMMRSIPAHAGEPAGVDLVGINGQVYPRPRGGTEPTPPTFRTGGGLSPPTRGNRYCGTPA